MKPDEIDANAVRDADILALRTRTKVNEALLAGSRVRMVCTATIGFDHIDTAYCDAHDIRWISCPGCNAQAVCNYIEEALAETCLSPEGELESSATLGIVGVGHVGSLVAKMAERRGLRVLLNDPPKGIGVSLDTIAQNCDIITFHVPLTLHSQFSILNSQFSILNSQFSILHTASADRSRLCRDKNSQFSILNYPTYHLCNEAFLAKCKPGALIINAARGGVVDEQALLRSGHPYILDTWENEPYIHPDVARNALRASMHIAGYSVQGKRNATQMCLDAIAEAFALPHIDIAQYPYTDTKKGDSAPGWLTRISDSLKADPTAFELLRKSYPLREE